MGTDSSSESSLEVVVRFRLSPALAVVAFLVAVDAFFFEAAGTAFDDGLLPVLIAFELDEGPLMDWRPAAVDFLAGEAVVDLVWREEAVFRFFAEAEVSSSATSSESEGLLLSSSFCSCASSSEVCSRLLRRAGAAFSSAAGHGQRADTHTTQPASSCTHHQTSLLSPGRSSTQAWTPSMRAC